MPPDDMELVACGILSGQHANQSTETFASSTYSQTHITTLILLTFWFLHLWQINCPGLEGMRMRRLIACVVAEVEGADLVRPCCLVSFGFPFGFVRFLISLVVVIFDVRVVQIVRAARSLYSPAGLSLDSSIHLER